MIGARLGLLAALAVGTAGSAQGATVYVATIDGMINPAVADYVERVLEESSKAGADALVIELDTPGGLVSSTEDIVKGILNASLPVIVFVSPRGASATSAGVFITLAAHVAVMAPGTSIGAAHPVPALPSSAPPPEDGESDAEPEPRDVMSEKVENWAAAFIESIAEMRERNVEWAADAVRNSVAITQKEALEKNVVDLVAEDVNDVLERVNGRVVRVGREQVEIETAGARLVAVSMGVMNRFFDVIAHPNITMLLILAGLGGLYVEISNPGLIVPGALGLMSLLLAGLSLQIIPFNSIGLLLLLAGVGLMVAEVFVASFGLLFGAGLLCMALGGYMLFDVPELSGVRVSFVSVILPAVLGFGLFGAIIVFGVSRSLARPQSSGWEGMIGTTAVADDDIAPTGRVFLHGELWNAEADQPVRAGETVEVIAIRDLVLRVARVGDPAEETS